MLRPRTSRMSALLVLVALVGLAAVQGPGIAAPFHPEVLAQLRADGTLAAKVASIQDARSRGCDQPPAAPHPWLRSPALKDGIIPDRNAIVILVDFSDNEADQQQYPTEHYEEMLFSVETYPTGSMRDWYLENSYGQFNVTGQVTIWLRMPQTYAYYVDGQAGFGSYPHNAQKLSEDAVVAADPYVDFSQFDNDGPDGVPNSGDDDGYVDALFVVHAGPGRETTGDDNDIHSHAWVMQVPQNVDGVTAYRYSMEPEDGRRGVFGHEFGHVLGLPDLYDTDYSSSGVGNWCMMSFGSWGGGGLTPVHFLSWCKDRLGFLTFEEPRTNLVGAALPQVETNSVAYALWTGGYPETQFFTVENRQRVGSDVSLPGHGLIICHVDETSPGNFNENHPIVAVEQADGLFELENGGPSNQGDPWPGSTDHRTFNDTSVPNTRDYGNNPTQVAVTNISDSGPNMTANLQVENAPDLILHSFDTVEFVGNGDGDIDPGETWDMPVTLFNRGLAASDVAGTLSSTSGEVTILTGASSFGTVPAEQSVTGTPPFRVELSSGSTADGIPFDLQIDYAPGQSIPLELVVGVNDSLGVFNWDHASGTSGYVDQWHISTQRNHTPGGTYSWKCGAQGAGQYANFVDATLITPSLPLSTVDAVRFWHWMDAEDGGGGTAWDGGTVEASVDGGPWTQITPDGGYGYTIIANPDSPFPGGMPCFSGSHDWLEERFDLTGLSGDLVRLRFRFGSDGAVAGEGWYIDDIAIEGFIPSSVDGERNLAGRLFLAPPRPNPATRGVVLGFTQPAGQPARLVLVDAGGRQVTAWGWSAVNGTTERELLWDGRTPEGGSIPSGVYFLKLEAGSQVATRRLLWIH